MGKRPTSVGVPDSTGPAAAMPLGRSPSMSIATGGMPPVVVNVSAVTVVPEIAIIVAAAGRTTMDGQLTTRLYASLCVQPEPSVTAVSYTHLRAHETVLDLVCRLLLEQKQ